MLEKIGDGEVEVAVEADDVVLGSARQQELVVGEVAISKSLQ